MSLVHFRHLVVAASSAVIAAAVPAPPAGSSGPGPVFSEAISRSFTVVAPHEPQLVEATSRAVTVLHTPSGLCPGDADSNGVVDVNDLVAVVLGWGVCTAAGCPDMTNDCLVSVADLVQVILNWGACT